MNLRWLRPIKRQLFRLPIKRLLAEMEEIHDAVWEREKHYGPLGASGDRPERPHPEWLCEAALGRYNLRPVALRLHLHSEGGRLLAYMITQDYPNTVDVMHLVVHPSFQGQGIGRQLMDLAFEQARGRGTKALMLQCYRFNEKALRFFRASEPAPVEHEEGAQLTFEFPVS